MCQLNIAAFAALLALFSVIAAPSSLSAAEQAKLVRACPAFGRPCVCEVRLRDCVPTCQIQPRIECSVVGTR